MSKMRPNLARVWGVAALAALLLGATLFLRARISAVRNDYIALAAQTPVVTISPPPLAFRPIALLLREGSIGPEVVALQQRLAQLGYLVGDIDGEYGAVTKGAVTIFQSQHGLLSDGVAGEATLALLMSPQAKLRDSAGASPSPAYTAPPGTYSTPNP